MQLSVGQSEVTLLFRSCHVRELIQLAPSRRLNILLAANRLAKQKVRLEQR